MHAAAARLVRGWTSPLPVRRMGSCYALSLVARAGTVRSGREAIQRHVRQWQALDMRKICLMGKRENRLVT